MPSSPRDLCERWLQIEDQEITVDDVQDTLHHVKDDLWVTAACADRILDDAVVQRAILELGLERTNPAIERCKNVYPVGTDDSDAQSSEDASSPQGPNDALTSYFSDETGDAQICYIRSILLDRLDRLNTYEEMCKVGGKRGKESEGSDADEEWEDDPWDDGGETEEMDNTPIDSIPSLPLSDFLTFPFIQSACTLATQQLFPCLQILIQHHAPQLWPYRFFMLDSIPEHAHPQEFRDLLPAFDMTSNTEQQYDSKPWRTEIDWSELPAVSQFMKASNVIQLVDAPSPAGLDDVTQVEPLTPQELTAWYRKRVQYVLDTTGMADIALAMIQHGASQGIPDLDELGEELSLLSRLVYDAQISDIGDSYEEWTLDRWRAMDPPTVLRAYLAHATPESIVTSIQKLVMPYLFVLEAREERSGRSESNLSTQLLHEYILSAPLEMIASIFEASKPTLPASQRLIRDDQDMVRLALACLYGSDSTDEWPTMSRIFECLPVWPSDPNDEDQADAADMTIASLGAFVTPSTTRPRVTPQELLVFFKPLPITSLSRALDILDVHLESGEIFSRWSVASPLRWFLQSAGDEALQRAYATRMARRAGGTDDQLDTQGDWEWLLEDMVKLTTTSEAGVKSAFGLLTKTEVLKIFFGGLLSTGKFDIAKSLLKSRQNSLSLEPDVIQDICLTCSREFYDNSHSGNYRFGDMKLAYDCLSVPPPSDEIIREQEFIEATSRITSFNVMSRPGIPISPLEIRLTKDHLSLVSRVLSSNADAYKYTEVILDLVHKLGFRDDPSAEVKALAMMADTALQNEDFTRAVEASETMIEKVMALRSSASTPVAVEDQKVQEAIEVCWVGCYQLGRQPEFADVPKKMTLLGRALELCPADKMPDVLNAWRRLEAEDIEFRKDKLSRRQKGELNGRDVTRSAKRQRTSGTYSLGNTPSSLAARFQNLHMPDIHIPSSPLVHTPDTAALAQTFSRVAANFTSLGAGVRRPDSRQSMASNESSARRDGSRDRSAVRGSMEGRPEGDVSAQASRVFQKGIGWLLGADEDQ